MATRRKRPRGIILLVVLALLTLFALMTMTFVLVATQAKRAALAGAYVERRGDPPQVLLEEAALQVLRGTQNPASALGPHSLLEDIYGHRAIRGSVNSSGWIPGTGVPADPPGPMTEIWATTTGPAFSTIDGYYNGRVLTMLTGPAAGQSTRIVDYRTGAQTVFRVMSFPNRALPNQGDQFVINGRPFSGTGFGLPQNPSGNTLLDEIDQHVLFAIGNPGDPQLNPELALLPNAAHFVPFGAYPDAAGWGGANEDYDAADYQNMLLALRVEAGSPPSPTVPIPSLHRPDLLQYWYQRLAQYIFDNWTTLNGSNPTPPNVDAVLPMIMQPFVPVGDRGTDDDPPFVPQLTELVLHLHRRISLRPTVYDHPDFTGSNGTIPFNAIAGPWDVDNDGDGIPDSVWVDLGLPAQVAPDGRQYKPLFAILCLDLDGRLNLNAHGNLAQLVEDGTLRDNPMAYYSTGGSQTDPTMGQRLVSGPFTWQPPAQPVPLPVGQGYGPAEINLQPLFAGTSDVRSGLPDPGSPLPGSAGYDEYRSLLTGNMLQPGRYGEWNLPGGTFPAGHLPSMPGPGRTVRVDTDPNWLALVKHFDLPGVIHNAPWAPYDNPRYWDPTNVGPYRTPPDINGNGALALDLRGVPYWPDHLMVDGVGEYTRVGFSETAERGANPYQLDLSLNAQHGGYALPGGGLTSIDQPFSAEELERLLRFNDIDASSMPDRLLQLANEAFVVGPNAALNRHRVTTDSWDLPTPNYTALPDDSAGESTLDEAIAAGDTPSLIGLLRRRLAENGFSGDMSVAVRSLLSPDLLAGLRFDLNRRFPDASEIWQGTPYGTRQFDSAYDGTVDFVDPAGMGNPTDYTDVGLLSRQAYAKQLYVLLYMLADQDWLTAYMPESARYLAQLAVNIVDYRDADSIMTRFEYDVAPFLDTNGDGDPWETASTEVVWGCERPELLITETLAFHDRRTEDRDDDETGETKADGDDDFDQRLRPEGSLFVELYNPNPAGAARNELSQGTPPGVDLTQTTPGGHPVWRLVIAKHDHTVPGTPMLDPDEPDPAKQPEIERSAYFITGMTGTYGNEGHVRYERETGTPVAPILPGRYGVIGPDTGHSATPPAGVHETLVGQLAAGSNPGATRRIQLSPNINPNVKQVDVFDNTAAGSNYYDTTTEIQPPVAFVMGSATSGQRFSVSEPSGEPSDTMYPPVNVMTGMYDIVHDMPLDYARAQGDPDLAPVAMTGTTEAYRVVHLQRLADPTQDYDAATNPFRTVDSMPVDLTAFNGEDDDENLSGGLLGATFATRERGESFAGSLNLWQQEPTQRTNPLAPVDENPHQHRFHKILQHSLGYLNFRPYGDPLATSEITFGSSVTGYTAADYRGSPQVALPWLAWADRPFVSQYELLQVSPFRSSQLLGMYSLSAGTELYHPPLPATPDVVAPHSQTMTFRHLAPFFADRDPGDATKIVPLLSRLLEYVHVPSRFVGTETFLDPETFENRPSGTVAEVQTPSGTWVHHFYPPYNSVSRYREPGKVNINTIVDTSVWSGVTNGTAGGLFPSFDDLADSRQGYTPTGGGTWYAPDPGYPSVFSNPFRSFGGNQLVPLASLRRDREIDVTLLRPEDGSAPLEPLFAASIATPYNSSDRNPYFRYLPLQKLGNLVTTRSNVYAVWITVGYFEVQQGPVDLAHPDGFRLGRELGSETGEVQRHRAFYLFDRTIPVAFERGRDHNVEHAIRLRRFIE